MRILIENSNGVHDVSQLVPSVTWSGEYNQCSRRLEFSILVSPTDRNIPVVSIALGNVVRLYEGNVELFVGYIFKREKDTDGNVIDIVCLDAGVYLLRNKYSYKFSNVSCENITKRIASDFGIPLGSVATTGIVINKNFLGVDLYSIIMSSYNEASSKNSIKYMITFSGGKLNVIEKGTVQLSVVLEPGSKLFKSSYSESIERMVNAVSVFNKDDKLIETIKNDDHIKLYGLMKDYYRQVDGVDYKSKARFMLKGIERKVSTTTIGDINCVTGKAVIVKEPYTGLNGKFFIDGDTHSWKNGIYTCKLVLNFQNMMDEKDSGRNPS